VAAETSTKSFLIFGGSSAVFKTSKDSLCDKTKLVQKRGADCYTNFWIHDIMLGSELLDPRNLDPRSWESRSWKSRFWASPWALALEEKEGDCCSLGQKNFRGCVGPLGCPGWLP